MVSQSAVWREPGRTPGSWQWFMYYSYRGRDGTLPGIRLATSTDGGHWTRQFNASDPRGMGQIFASTRDAYYEWHQIQKIGHTYLLLIEVGLNKGQRWRPVMAVSAHPDRDWRQLEVDTVLQTKWEGLYRDDTLYHVATRPSIKSAAPGTSLPRHAPSLPIATTSTANGSSGPSPATAESPLCRAWMTYSFQGYPSSCVLPEACPNAGASANFRYFARIDGHGDENACPTFMD
ncbi:MAG: hypothetical protein HS122_20110 [Opitutaceae bacterium]|nr:hypothetical protein [Opitutaceae bacterium]